MNSPRVPVNSPHDHTFCVESLNTDPLCLTTVLVVDITSDRLHREIVRILFLETHRETDRFLPDSGVQLAQTNHDIFRFHCLVFYSQLKSKVGNILTKAVALLINLIIDCTPIPSRSHTHPSNSQTSRLFSSSFSLGIPFPHSTQCVRGF